jgi:hypothetical protein
VFWAVDRTERSDGSTWHAPLDPVAVGELDVRPQVVVLASSTGEAAVIAPLLYNLHVCPPEVVEEMLRSIGGLGYYTAEVLAIPCPVRPCKAAPGMLCLTSRREAQHRPHGARVVAAAGEELEDPTF